MRREVDAMKVRMQNILMTATTLALLGALGCAGPQPAVERGAALYANCKMCHMADGSGMKDIGAPNIAGLPAWYVEAQLMKFQEGSRGLHFDDEEGMRMRPMALALQTQQDVRSVARHVSELPKNKTERLMTKGNADAGKAMFGTCAACHGQNGEGKPELSAPPLTTINDWYIANQIHKFKKGMRGADVRDVSGGQMRAMAGTLATEQTLNDVIAYIGTLAEKN